MYDHPDYKDKNPEAITEFISNYPLAVISGCHLNYQPVATQVPVLMEEREGKQYLRGHMIRNATHHKAFAENPKVMLVFPGPQAYVSATWYKSGKSASTWNYMSVQATGKIRFLGEKALMEIMRQTTLHFEKGDVHSPTVYDNLGADYTDRLLPYIVAFEVEVETLDHVFKLSQEQDAASYQNIITQLKKGDANARMVADEMEKRIPGMFRE